MAASANGTDVQILQSAPAAEEAKVFWPEMRLVLQGALPNDNPKLGNDLRLTFGRLESVDGVKWREFVLGYSVLYDRGRRVSHYSFRDSEGRLTDVFDDGKRFRLVVEIDIADCCYGVKGGKARYEIELTGQPVADGRLPEHADSGTGTLRMRLTGKFAGQIDRPDCDIAGPGGILPCSGKVTGTLGAEPWPSPVEDWTPLRPNEHPRLIFRRADLPSLRARAQTPQGQVILARLEAGLEGEYSLCQAAGHGFLYQLTGDRKHAERARQAVDEALAGAPDKDGRYSFTSPGGKLRAGPSYAAIATAYDFCFDAWDEDYRKTLARKIQDAVYPSLIYETGSGQHNPHSNHYAAWKGGAGTALLAITGDDGVDQEIVRRSLRHIKGCIRRSIHVGYSERAYFYEGHYCGRISSNTGLVPFLQAAREAAGQDWIENSEAAQWLLTKWIFELYRRSGQVRSHMEGMYARPWKRGGGIGSGGGDFAQGFGILTEKHKPAVLYLFNHVLEPGPDKTYDVYDNPLRGAYSLVNWPIGTAEQDPIDVLGIAMWDRARNRAIFRNGFDGEDDIVCFMSGGITIRGPGLQASFPGIDTSTTYSKSEPGSRVCVASSQRTSLAVDFSGKCGTPALFVYVRKPAPPPAPAGLSPTEIQVLRRALAKKPTPGRITVRDPQLKSGKHRPSPGTSEGEPATLAAKSADVDFGTVVFTLLTLQTGQPPEIRAEGEGNAGRVLVGERVVGFDGEKILLGR